LSSGEERRLNYPPLREAVPPTIIGSGLIKGSVVAIGLPGSPFLICLLFLRFLTWSTLMPG
jgi:hypothetical protein